MDVSRVHFLTVTADDAGQRLDNFLRKRYPALPKSRIYQMLRRGEVRVNKKRAKPELRVAAGDELRLPPFGASASRAPFFMKTTISLCSTSPRALPCMAAASSRMA